MTALRIVRDVSRRFDDAVLLPARAQRNRTPNDRQIDAHEHAFHTPREGFEAALSCGIVALRDYACAHELAYGAPLASDPVMGGAWLEALRGFRQLLTGERGRLQGGFLDGACCNLYEAAGFEGEL